MVHLVVSHNHEDRRGVLGGLWVVLQHPLQQRKGHFGEQGLLPCFGNQVLQEGDLGADRGVVGRALRDARVEGVPRAVEQCPDRRHGGSVLDDAHINNLLNGFEAIPKRERAACAFFFKEHVVSILRVDSEYHFVDSMPGEGGGGMGTRTCCADVNVLRCYIKHYAATKLAGQARYCDTNDWSELQAEFDPRVFQAFLWRNTP